MFCGKCGKENAEGTRFCGACGAPMMPEKSGSTPSKPSEPLPAEIKNKKQPVKGEVTPGELTRSEKKRIKKELKKKQREEKKRAKKLEKKEKWKKLPTKKKIKKICLRALAVALALLIVGAGVTVALVHFKVVDIPFIEKVLNFVTKSGTDGGEGVAGGDNEKANEENIKKQQEMNEEIQMLESATDIEPIDTDEYFRENSTVISEMSASASGVVRSEMDAYNNMIDRGFTQQPIETQYSMDGTFHEATEIYSSSAEKHPIYQTYYVTENGDVWLILEINGVVMASPLSYNAYYDRSVEVIISETGTVMSYDSRTSKFYETIPNESELVVKTVTRIDAETLENLTYGEINGL